MPLKIKVSELDFPLFMAMGGKQIEQDVYARLTFQPDYKGFDTTFEFRFFFDTQKEDEFASLDLIKTIEQTVNVLDENDQPTGETTTQQVKVAIKKKGYRYTTVQPLTGQINAMTEDYYEQIKDVPQIAQIAQIAGDNVVKSNIGTHFIAKHLLEQVFGEGTVEIDLFLQ